MGNILQLLCLNSIIKGRKAKRVKGDEGKTRRRNVVSDMASDDDDDNDSSNDDVEGAYDQLFQLYHKEALKFAKG